MDGGISFAAIQKRDGKFRLSLLRFFIAFESVIEFDPTNNISRNRTHRFKISQEEI